MKEGDCQTQIRLHMPAASNLSKNSKLASIWLKQNPSKRTEKGAGHRDLNKKFI